MRRTTPAKPTRPVPSSPRVPGSGTVLPKVMPISMLPFQAPVVFIVIVSVPPPFAKNPVIRIELPELDELVVTVPLENTPLNKVVPVPEITVTLPPV